MIQIAENFEEDTHKMKWRTITEVAKILLDTATVTQAECTAAVEAARAICCLARSGSICFDLDSLIKDYSRNTTKKRNKMKDEFEGRWRMEEEEISRLSRSLSSSVHVTFLIQALLKR